MRRFGVIFAGAQKNCGIAGLTIVIIKKSLLGLQRNDIPIALSYKTAHEHQSMSVASRVAAAAAAAAPRTRGVATVTGGA